MKNCRTSLVKFIFFIQILFLYSGALNAAPAWWEGVIDPKKVKEVLPELVEMIACSPILKGKAKKIVHACIFMAKAGQIVVKLRPDEEALPAENDELKNFEALDALERQEIIYDLLSRSDLVGPSLAIALSLKSEKSHEHIQVFSAWKSAYAFREKHQKEALQIITLDAALRANDQKTLAYMLLGENFILKEAMIYLRQRWDSKNSNINRTIKEVSELGQGLPGGSNTQKRIVEKLLSFPEISESRLIRLLLSDLPRAKRSFQVAFAVAFAKGEELIRECERALKDLNN
ncbi:MAG: hypothetical protein KA116_11055 [Proteobacteria bacterium]|nr:hypothetical protein [Pseudomonadota bacterium]